MIDSNENVIKIERNQIIFNEGDEAMYLYFILVGEVSLVKNINGKNSLLFKIGKNSLIGKESILGLTKRNFTAVAETDCKLREITKDEVWNSQKYLSSVLCSLNFRCNHLLNNLIDSSFVFNEYHFADEFSSLQKKYDIKLIPVTSRAKKMLNNKSEITVDKLPFTVGRYSKKKADKFLYRNDLDLHDHHPYCVSRSHFSLELTEGKIVIRDLKSKLGITINEDKLKSKHEFLTKTLKKGENTIFIGSRSDNVVFKIIIQ